MRLAPGYSTRNSHSKAALWVAMPPCFHAAQLAIFQRSSRPLVAVPPFSQGIPLKLLAVESLLEKYPELRGKVVMFVVVRDDGRRGDR